MNLIPFAYLSNTKGLVDVADVPSGRACGCICPSCGLPLIAKKGEVKDWHFAHDSKYVEEEQSKICDFSWPIAVRMMCKQLLLDGSELALPDYFIKLPNIGYNKPKTMIQVTKSSRINYQEACLERLGCDLTLDVKGATIGILFCSQFNSDEGHRVFDPQLTGVIGIDVRAFWVRERNSKAVNHFREYLKTKLAESDTAKFWLYHARENRIVEKETSRQRALNNTRLPEMVVEEDLITAFPESKKEKARWLCISCEHYYSGFQIGLNACPKCGSHLYRRQV